MPPSRLRHAAADERGIGIVEAVVSAALLLTGIVAALTVLDGSRELTSVTERFQTAVHHGEQALEQARAADVAALATTAPASANTGDTGDPRRFVSGTSFDWDMDTGTAAPEPLVVRADGLPSRTRWGTEATGGDGRVAGTIDRFVTTASSEPPVLKRVTVVVRVDGGSPARPVVLSSLVSAGSAPAALPAPVPQWAPADEDEDEDEED